MPIGTEPRKKRNSTKVNLIISATFHAVLVGALLYFAARQGLLGKQLKKISIEMVKTEKPKEQPKPKEPDKPKVEVPKTETPKVTEVAKVEPPKETAAAPPPTTMAPPTVAPPVSEAPAFEFDGGKPVVSSSDPVQLYKGLLENSVRFNWDRPKGMDDHTNEADVDVAVDKQGNLSDPIWKKLSGQKQWDDSVRLALANTAKVSRPPPSNFPPRVTIRFDVEAMASVGQP